MEKVLTISKDYLLVPVKKEAEKRLLTFWCGTEKIYEFEISCVDTEETYPEDFCAVLPVKKWKGQKIRIEGDVCESLLSAVRERSLLCGKTADISISCRKQAGSMIQMD